MGVGSQRHALSALPPGLRPRTHCIGGCMGPRAGLEGCRKSRPPLGFDPRTVQPVASHYTDRALLAHENTGDGNKILGFSTTVYCCAGLCGYETCVILHSVAGDGGLLGRYCVLLGECYVTLWGLLCHQNVRYHPNSDMASHPTRLIFFGGGQGLHSASFDICPVKSNNAFWCLRNSYKRYICM